MLRVLDFAELSSLVGQEVAVSDWLTLDQARIRQFAEATGDRQWIHTDEQRARAESPYGTTIAHGFLTLSLLSRLISDAVEIRGPFPYRINYGLNRVRFPAPVPAGARLRGRFTLASVEPVEGAVQVTWAIRVEIENAPKPALYAEWLVRLYSA